MNYTTLIAAAALATLPVMAQAAFVPITDDGASTISGANDDIFTFNVIPGDGDFNHEFTLTNDGNGTAEVSLTTGIAAGFVGLVAQWLAADGSVLSSAGPDANGDIILSTAFVGPASLIQTLNISWTSVAKGVPDFDGQVTVSTVPVPAGLLLMGTALAGLGLTRRKA